MKPVSYTHLLQLIEKKIKNYTSVSDLLYRKDMMQMVNDNVKRVSLILLTLAVMLMAISFVLISNCLLYTSNGSQTRIKERNRTNLFTFSH